MKKILIILLSVSILILFPCTFQFAAAEDSSSNSTNEKTETYTAMYTGQGQYRNYWIDKRTYKFTFTGCKTDHDVSILRISSLDADKEAYYTFWIYYNDGVVVACNASGTKEDIRDGKTEYDMEWSNAYCPETQIGSTYSDHKDVSTSMSASSSIPMFDDYNDVKQFLADGTRGDSEVKQATENMTVDIPHDFMVQIPVGLTGSLSNNTSTTGQNIKFSWTQKENDNNKDLYHTEIYIVKASGKYGKLGFGSIFSGTIKYKNDWRVENSLLLDLQSKDYITDSNKYKYVEGYSNFKDFINLNKILPSNDTIGSLDGYYFGDSKDDVCVKARNYILLGDGKKYSDWTVFNGIAQVVVSDDSSDSTNDIISDNSDFEQHLEDSDGKKYDEEDRSAVQENDSSSSDTSFNFFEWCNDRVKSLNKLMKSLASAFDQSVDTGSSFVSMFKSYNSWLPEAFVSMLVAGIGIAVFLRIIGR